MVGFVYIAENASLPDVIKVGVSTNINDRLRKLKSTGVPTPFTLVCGYSFDHPELVESEFHDYFRDYRVADNREFFKMASKYARFWLKSKLLTEPDNVEKLDGIVSMEEEVCAAVEKANLRGVDPAHIVYVLNRHIVNLVLCESAE